MGPISPPAASPLGLSPVWAQQPSELQPSAHPPAGAPLRQPALLQSTPLVTPPSRPQSLLHLHSPPAADASAAEATAQTDAQMTVTSPAGDGSKDSGLLEPAVLASQCNDPSSVPAASNAEAITASAAHDGAQGISAGAGAEVEAEAAAPSDGEGSTSEATPPHTPDAASRSASAAPVQVPPNHKDQL